MKLTVENQYNLLAWAAPRCGVQELWPTESEAMGVIDETGELVCVFVVNAIYGDTCTAHIATDGGARWAQRNVLRGFFGYLFIVKEMTRVQAVIPVNRRPALVMATKVGFIFEGVMRRGAADGSDAVLMAMLREECPWITDIAQDAPDIEAETAAENEAEATET